jgi:hypothetical protein
MTSKARHVLCLVAAAVLFGSIVSSSLASTPGPGWEVRSVALPSNFSFGDNALCESVEACDTYVVSVTNVGTRPSSGSVTITDRLPGVVKEHNYENAMEHEPGGGNVSGHVFHCHASAELVSCSYPIPVPPGGVLEFGVEVTVSTEASAMATNEVEVEGGGAASETSALPGTAPNTVNGSSPGFGLQDFGTGVLGPEGASDVQAGDHPATNTTTLDWTTLLDKEISSEKYFQTQESKSDIVDLPPGFVGDPLALERCAASAVVGTALHPEKCPVGSRVGYAAVESGGGQPYIPAIYNIVPESGYPAEFAFEYNEALVTLVPRLLPASGQYVLSVSAPYIPKLQALKVTGVKTTLFGDPGERDGVGSGEAFLTNPVACAAGPLKARSETDSWVDPSSWLAAETTMFEANASHGVIGCGSLTFQPTIAVTPETTETDTPSGYEVNLKVPQAANVSGVLATPDLKNEVVTLPEGVSVSPGAANGLQACQETGPEGIELGSRDAMSDGNQVQEGEERASDGLVHPEAGHCPQASQIGEVELITPLLAEPLTGHVFIAEPHCGGAGQPGCTAAFAEDGELYGIYLEIGSVPSGIHVKLRGNVSVNPQTGQLTTRFTETPELPFSELKLKLNGGPRASLANPQACGPFTTTSDLTPWSAPETPDATPSSTISIGGCSGAFAPSLLAGSLNAAAGAYSPFTLTFARHDGEEDLSGITVNMPKGLIGKIAGIAKCGEAEIKAAEGNTGSCPAASQIGTTTAAAGAGSAPFYQSGPVYLTGPYNGAPFGLAVVVAANAGPYHLGNIVVRAAIHIDPSTAAVTVVSNPLPQMIDGVPLRVQSVNVTVGQQGDFTFNPTSCAQSSVNATITGLHGAVANVSYPFQATGCANLPFKPVFTASTAAKTSKTDGASLVVKITAKPGEANIARTDLQLPLALPSRLTTLQKACTEAQFNKNPAGCPEGAEIGEVTVKTPLLNVPLTGPMYLVSHGGAAFPDVEIILQGEGVEIVLDGKTDIKKGITYSNFETVPDAPFSSFEANLPEGAHSAFTTEYPGITNLCSPTRTVTVRKKVTKRVGGKSKKVTKSVIQTEPEKLEIATKLVGQNGAVLTQGTKIAVSGCPKASAKPKAKKADKTSSSSNAKREA